MGFRMPTPVRRKNSPYFWLRKRVPERFRAIVGTSEVWRSLELADRRAAIAKCACACRKSNPAILVMQSAQDWATKNAPGAVDGARDRRIFVQG
jgi:hypothetical protein